MANRKPADVVFVSFVFIVDVRKLVIIRKDSAHLQTGLPIRVGLTLSS
jgi:hypothetical protein